MFYATFMLFIVMEWNKLLSLLLLLSSLFLSSLSPQLQCFFIDIILIILPHFFVAAIRLTLTYFTLHHLDTTNETIGCGSIFLRYFFNVTLERTRLVPKPKYHENGECKTKQIPMVYACTNKFPSGVK